MTESTRPLRFFVGITGGSGHIYAERLIAELLLAGCHVDLSATEAGCKVLRHERGIDAGVPGRAPRGRAPGLAGAARGHRGAPRAGARLRIRRGGGPGRVGHLAHGRGRRRAVQHGDTGSRDGRLQLELVERAADVALKEGRRLLLMPRETPLSEIHLENMLRAVRLGAIVLPCMPGFYHGPSTIDDLVKHVVGKALDRLGVEQDVGARWQGFEEPEGDPWYGHARSGDGT